MSACTAIHEEVHPPTAIFHSVTAWLSQPYRANAFPELVVSKGTLLEVYSLVQQGGDTKLAQLYSTPLSGFVESLACLPYRYPGQGRDALVLTFRDAKAVVLTWDVASCSLVTSSLHYLEGDSQLRHGRSTFEREPLALADPEGRCAAVVFYGSCVAVLPAVIPDALEHVVSGNLDLANGTSEAATVGNSYINDLQLSMDISQVRAATFLHGYSEPVLLILHETTPSWAGAQSTAKDTCMLSALSLSMGRRSQTCIWHVDGLPSDGQRIFSSPSGGALLLSLAGILFVNQGTTTGIVTSSWCVARQSAPPLQFDPSGEELPGKTAARYANDHHEPPSDVLPAALLRSPRAQDVDAECESGVVSWISNDLALLSIKSGQLLLVRLVHGAGTVTAIKVTPTGAAPPATSLAMLSSSLFFLASCLGDSLLITAQTSQLGTGPEGDLSTGEDEHGRAQDRAAVEGTQGMDIDEEEALQLYGVALSTTATGNGIDSSQVPPRFTLTVLDSLSSMGPIRDMAVIQGDEDLPFLAMCSGQSKTGALCVLRQSVVPSMITTVPLPGVIGLWALRIRQEVDSPPHNGHEVPFDDYLVMSFVDRTKLLATGDELQEATDVVEFAADAPTVAAGSMAGGRALIQVFAQGLRMLRGTEHLADYWIADLIPSGENSRQSQKEDSSASQNQTSIISASISDAHVLLLLSLGRVVVLRVDTSTLQLVAIPIPDKLVDINSPVCACCLSEGPLLLPETQAADRYEPNNAPCLLICRLDGGVEVYDIQTWRVVGRLKLDAAGPVAEVRLDAFGPLSSIRPDLTDPRPSSVALAPNPLLMVLLRDGTLLAYASYWHGQMLRFRPFNTWKLPDLGPMDQPRPARMRRFEGLGEDLAYSGLVVTGPRPCLLVATRHCLVMHPFFVGHNQGGQPTEMAAFTPFHNVNCPFGFVSSTGGGIQIGQFPYHTRLDSPWPRQKLALRATPLRVTSYPEAGLLALVLAKQAPHADLLPEEDGSEPHASYAYALAGAVGGKSAVRHEVCLMQPGTWTTVWRHSLGPEEHGLAVRTVRLQSTDGVTIPFLAIGAGFLAGEDYPCLGRLLLCEIKRGQDGEWAPQVVYTRDFRGPVTKLDVIAGALLVASGNRLELCTLVVSEVTGGERTYSLQRSAFYDGAMLINSLHVIKNFILIGDPLHGLEFVNYSSEKRQFSQLSRDAGRRPSLAGALLVAGRRLQMVSCGLDGTLRIYSYDPADPESWKGHHLMHRASFHIGEPASVMLEVNLAAQGQPAHLGVLVGAPSGAICLLRGNLSHESLSTDAIDGVLHALALAGPAPAGLNASAWRNRGTSGYESGRVLDAALHLALRDLLPSRRSPIAAAVELVEHLLPDQAPFM